MTIHGFHAHIYYHTATRDVAARIREALDANFDVQLGRWRDSPVGPHPKAMYQVAFAPEHFGTLVPWLMLHREGLDVLVHPETGDDLADHRDRALWLGNRLELDLSALT
jgi:DOPA 4,5-dioxygenase